MKQTTLYFSTILLLSFCIGSKTFAKNTILKNYNFSDEKIEIPEKYKNETELILQKDVKIDLVTTENSALQYFLIHEKKWINSDDAVQRKGGDAAKRQRHVSSLSAAGHCLSSFIPCGARGRSSGRRRSSDTGEILRAGPRH